MKKEKNKKYEVGITLIALVVTVVVLIIIAGVTLSLTIGNGGIMKRAKSAVNDYASQDTKEEKHFNDLADWVDKNGRENEYIKVPVNTKTEENGTINGKKAGTNNPIIPEGYTPIDAGSAILLAKKIEKIPKTGCNTNPATNINLMSAPPNDSFLKIKFPSNIIKYIIKKVKIPLPSCSKPPFNPKFKKLTATIIILQVNVTSSGIII